MLSDAAYPEWSASVAIPRDQLPFTYKYAIRNADGSVSWETGPDRVTNIDPSHPPHQLFLNDEAFRYSLNTQLRSRH